MYTFRWIAIAVLALFVACGRYFPGAIRPVPEDQQGAYMAVKDDGTVLYKYERLEISLRPLSDEELNRTFASQSRAGAESTNPYTYGDWTPMGEDSTPQRFTVFLLKVKNYMYPKMRVDPYKAELVSENERSYVALTLAELSEYYRSHAQGQAGNLYEVFRERKDILKQTLYSGDNLFTGQDSEGYLVFPALHSDVTRFSVALRDIALRLDYQDKPIETLDLTFRFRRDVYKGYHPLSGSAMHSR